MQAKEPKDLRGDFTQVDPIGQIKSCIDFIFLPEGQSVAKAESTCFLDHCLLAVKAEMGCSLKEAGTYGT